MVIKELVKSKKFWMTIAGVVVTTSLKLFEAPDTVIVAVGSLFGVNVLGQGLADFGKSAAKYTGIGADKK